MYNYKGAGAPSTPGVSVTGKYIKGSRSSLWESQSSCFGKNITFKGAGAPSTPGLPLPQGSLYPRAPALGESQSKENNNQGVSLNFVFYALFCMFMGIIIILLRIF